MSKLLLLCLVSCSLSNSSGLQLASFADDYREWRKKTPVEKQQGLSLKQFTKEKEVVEHKRKELEALRAVAPDGVVKDAERALADEEKVVERLRKKAGVEQSTDEQSTDEQSTDEQSTDEQSTDEQTEAGILQKQQETEFQPDKQQNDRFLSQRPRASDATKEKEEDASNKENTGWYQAGRKVVANNKLYVAMACLAVMGLFVKIFACCCCRGKKGGEKEGKSAAKGGKNKGRKERNDKGRKDTKRNKSKKDKRTKHRSKSRPAKSNKNNSSNRRRKAETTFGLTTSESESSE